MTTLPDYNDPGYGEIGCLFMVGGIIVGWVVAIGGAILGLVPDPNPSRTVDPLVTLAAVTLDGYVAGTLASVGVMSITGRVRPLWGIAEWLVAAAWVLAPAIAIVWLTWTTAGDALAVPLAVAAIAIGASWFLVGMLQARRRGNPDASVAGGRSPRTSRPGPVARAVPQSTGGATPPDAGTDEDAAAPFATRKARLLGIFVVACFGTGALFLVTPTTPAGHVGEAAFGLGLVVSFGITLWAVLVGRQLPQLQRLGVALLSLCMVGVGVIAVLLAAGVDEAALSAHTSGLMILLLGITLVPAGAWVAFRSEESLFVRACGLVCIPFGAWMAWWSVATLVDGLLH